MPNAGSQPLRVLRGLFPLHARYLGERFVILERSFGVFQGTLRVPQPQVALGAGSEAVLVALSQLQRLEHNRGTSSVHRCI